MNNNISNISKHDVVIATSGFRRGYSIFRQGKKVACVRACTYSGDDMYRAVYVLGKSPEDDLIVVQSMCPDADVWTTDHTFPAKGTFIAGAHDYEANAWDPDMLPVPATQLAGTYAMIEKEMAV